MEQVAASLNLSYGRFRHVFKQQIGLAPHQYHLQVRINRAKELLRDTPMSVSKVAAALGFADLGYFSNVFKQRVGVRPSEWRSGGKRK